MSLTESTKFNLRRKSSYADTVQMVGAVPLFSWLDLNPTELCNRTCIFCPRADADAYPNQKLFMSLDLAGRIAAELRALDYQGVIVFSGYGEPLLHTRFTELIGLFKGMRIEIITNGDTLSPAVLRELYAAGTTYMVVSLYDGPHQVGVFEAMFAEAGLDKDSYLLRDRWHTDEDGFGLKLTNRAGMVQTGDQAPVDPTHPCHYPAYSMTIDWNGDVLLCMQDWHKRVKIANLHQQTLMEAWTSPALAKWRISLANGRRDKAPCKFCNTDGTLHGFNHLDVWTRARPPA